MKIAILGVGFLGITLYNYFKNIYEVIAADMSPVSPDIINLDASNEKELKLFLHRHEPDVIINTIALSSYYLCEMNRELCLKINYEIACSISKISNDLKSKLIFISSSYVFNGNKGDYSEIDVPDSNTAYAKSKIMAEYFALQYSNSLVLRIEPMFGFDRSFNKIRIGTNTFKNKIKIAYPNLIRSPVLVDDVPRVINDLILKKQSGVFNVASNIQLNWLQCLRQLATLEHAENQLEFVSSQDWILIPPHNTSLNTDKLLNLNSTITSFSKSLEILRALSSSN
jgi:dTDP-4-dehydrorhamnose reductase